MGGDHTMSDDPNILVLGTIRPESIGDLLQYVTTVHIMRRTGFNITFMAPLTLELLSNFENLNIKVPCVDSSIIKLFAFLNGNKYFDDSTSQYKKSSIKHFRELLYRLYTSKLPYATPISWFDAQIILSKLKRHTYSAGALIGHTISTPSIHHYVLNYKIIRELVKGPIITFPISISVNALKLLSKYNRYYTIKQLKSILEEFHIFVRGPFTLKLLREVIGLENAKIALDSGFGIKELISLNQFKRQSRRDIIYPEEYVVFTLRKDLHYYYGNNKSYQHYLNLVLNTLLEFIKDRNYRVCFLKHSTSWDATHHLISMLYRSQGTSLFDNKILIFNITDLTSICRVLSSARLVITSYMHIGIISMVLGVPTLFLQPVGEVKLLDIFSFLKIPPLIIDTFNPKVRESDLRERISWILDNMEVLTDLITNAIEQRYSTLYDPVNYLIKELSN